MKINSNYNNLEKSYLFSTINRKVAEYTAAHPEANVIKLGIGDVTRPLCPAVIDALHGAVSEMGVAETFRGYGDEQGYGFLSDAITEYYAKKGVTLEKGEVFISDGAKSDCGNILDLFSTDNTVLVPDPVYPVYVDTNVMAGRKITYMSGSEENGFLPMPESVTEKADIIYLCSPNNPTGAVYNKAQLEEWVAYANANDSIILFDSAYEAFIDDEELPTSIYEIEGAKTCAIELCSFSKTAGFTGTRCGYTVVPKALVREGASINAMWLRRQTTKFNGVPYIVQRGAEAVFSAEGYAQTRADLAYYKENAKIIASTFDELGITYFGGVHSPYIWMKTPDGMTSWEFFDKLLEEANVVGTPGSGFGKAGEGYFRLTAFNTKEKTLEAMERFKKLYNK